LRLFVRAFVETHRSEARTWLKAAGKKARSLGRFKRTNDAAKFVEELYQAGASQVMVPDIYRNQRGTQFADSLLVQLPRDTAGRKAVSCRLRAIAETESRRGRAGPGHG